MDHESITYTQVPPKEIVIFKAYYQGDDDTEPFEIDYREQTFLRPREDVEEVYSQNINIKGTHEFPTGWLEDISLAVLVAPKSNRGTISVDYREAPTGVVIPPGRIAVFHHDDYKSISFRCEDKAKLKVTVFPG